MISIAVETRLARISKEKWSRQLYDEKCHNINEKKIELTN
jgi:hypothetical protein